MWLASLFGWIMVGISIAAVACSERRSACVSSAEGRQGPDADQPDGWSGDGEAWCRAVEAVSGASAFLLDDGLRFVAAGPRGMKAFAKGRSNSHLIDIAPDDAVAAFLDGASAARRGELRSWEFACRGRTSMAAACPVGKSGFLLWIRENRR